jgi:hypothetical protein
MEFLFLATAASSGHSSVSHAQAISGWSQSRKSTDFQLAWDPLYTASERTHRKHLFLIIPPLFIVYSLQRERVYRVVA